jgi:PsbP
MRLRQRRRCAAALVATSAIACGCGSSSHGSTPAGAGASGGSAAGATNANSPAALSAEARSAGTGDIPDNQVFLVFRNGRGGYSIKYPEGWTQQGGGADVTFKDKNNLVHIVIVRAGAPSAGSVATQLSALKRTTPTLAFTAPHPVRLGSVQAVKATYTTRSAPNPVTGRRVTLTVDRYELAHSGRVAVVDLGTPKGVDNVDAYRMMIESFHWR